MKERPILFSTAMVQAIMDGKKTQTRRTISASRSGECSIKKKLLDFNEIYPNGSFGVKVAQKDNNQDGVTKQLWRVAPPYEVGDLLWVRESWRPISWDGDRFGVQVEFKDGATICGELFDDPDKDIDFEMKCSDIMHGKNIEYDTETESGYEGWTSDLIRKHMPWRPSIHMPKAAARIWLKVTNVRVERLQDISEADIKSEGCTWPKVKDGGQPKDYSEHFQKNMWLSIWIDLWESINGNASWNANPWVWVVEFEVASKSGKR